MASKKILAILLLVVVVMSLIGTTLVGMNFVKENNYDLAKVKLFVEKKAVQPTALVSLTVLPKQR